MTKPQVMVIAAYDSQLKWAMGLAREFATQGWQYSVVVPADIRHALSDEQVAAVGVTDLKSYPWQELLRLARTQDCVILAIQGPLVEQFTDELAILREAEPAQREPVIVTGWVGIIIEKVIAGYLDRAASDVVAVNSADNLREFTRAGDDLGIPADNLLLSGLPLLPAKPAPLGTGPVRTVLFADQPTVPREPWDRAYVYQRLIDYAIAHPDRKVLLKPRHRLDEDTFHVMKHHPETVISQLPTPPVNFEIVYTPITELLDSIDLMLTVSSTAALEALGAGVRTAFIGDLGVHEKFGNHVLTPSGLITTFGALEADELPVPHPEWLDDLFVSGDDLSPAQRVVRRVEELRVLPPADRPGAAVQAGRYVSGRLAIRKRRATMPEPARVPTSNWKSRSSFQAVLIRRASWFARAVLPASWFVALRRKARSR